MDRTIEFMKYVSTNTEPSGKTNFKPFYVEFNDEINVFSEKVFKTTSYNNILKIEDEVYKLQKKINSVLDNIQISKSNNVAAHYNGIKQIIGLKIINLQKWIQETKKKLCRFDSELFSEKPELEKNTESEHIDNLMEKENKEILANTSYEITRMRLKKIEKVQMAINENLNMQDERIDNICETTGKTTVMLEDINCEESFEDGNFFRRTLFIMLICLSIVLLFLHFLS